MRAHRSKLVLTLFASLMASITLAACASSGGGGGSDSPRRDPNLISAEELAEYGTYTAMDVIRRLRPRWLRSRGTSSSGTISPQVIVDGARMGSIDSLRSVSVADVQSLRFLSASDATMRFGTNFPGGAIEVTSRAR